MERFHRYLNSAVSILYNKQGVDWDRYVPSVLFAYRVNDTTGFSPFYLETGRHPNLPIHTIFKEIEPIEGIQEENQVKEHRVCEEWASDIVQRLRNAFAVVRGQQEQIARKNRERTIEKRVEPDFKSGDFLFLWERAAVETRLQQEENKVTGSQGGMVPTKFKNAWTGPYECVSVRDGRYATINKNGKIETHNVNRLWKNIPWDEFHPDTSVAFREREEKKNEKTGQILEEEKGYKEKEKNAKEKEKKSESEIQQESTKRRIQQGEFVFFAKKMDSLDTLPFFWCRLCPRGNQPGRHQIPMAR